MIRKATISTRTLIASAAVALTLAAAPQLFAQDSRAPQAPPSQAQQPPQTQQPPAAQQPHDQQQFKTAQGQLTRVDTDARTIAITSQGAPMVFRYTADTKVVGGDKGVAGLATMTGTEVTVQYVQQEKDNVASQIEIRGKR
jgi:glucose/arabinose dehydrogenase